MDKMHTQSPAPAREQGRIPAADREAGSKTETRRLQRRRLNQVTRREIRREEEE